MKTYDAIVVGAGHNGLTNAAFLAKSGLDVLCLERNDYIGGVMAAPGCNAAREILLDLKRPDITPVNFGDD